MTDPLKPDTNTATAPAPAPPAAPDMSELARNISELLARDRGFGPALTDTPRPALRAPRVPLISPKIKAAITQSIALWPLYVINALLLWLVLVVFNDTPSALYVERVARILQLASIALLFDVWLHPLQHPDSLDGPAQGARQYQRIYLIGIFVVSGCIAL